MRHAARGRGRSAATIGTLGLFLVCLLAAAGCAGDGGSSGGDQAAGAGAATATPSATASGGDAASGGSPAPGVVQAAPVRYVTVGDLSVGYRVVGAAGDGTPLLLIMGSSGTMDLWSPEFVAALAQDRQVIVFDNRGIGETDDPKGAYPFSQLADDTAGLIEALGYDSLDVLGWSMGGDVAIDLAVRHPERVASLISHAGDAGGGKAIPPTKEALSVLSDTSGSPRERGRKLIELLFPASYRSAHPDYAESFPIPTEQAAPEAIGLQNQAIGEWAGVWDGLSGISCPVLFVTGTEDELTPARNAVMMAERVPASWLVRFPGAGHGLMYQDPQSLADVVEVFLTSGG